MGVSMPIVPHLVDGENFTRTTQDAFEAAARFGVAPNFFRSALDAPFVDAEVHQPGAVIHNTGSAGGLIQYA
jgi:hypothetical protein